MGSNGADIGVRIGTRPWCAAPAAGDEIGDEALVDLYGLGPSARALRDVAVRESPGLVIDGAGAPIGLDLRKMVDRSVFPRTQGRLGTEPAPKDLFAAALRGVAASEGIT